MPEYFRIKVGDNGKTFVVDEEGNRIPPERHREIAAKITETVGEDAFVYVGYSQTKMLYKIGKSNDPIRREKELGIDVFITFKCEPWGEYSALAYEKILHNFFIGMGSHVAGEWFELDMVDLHFLKDLGRTRFGGQHTPRKLFENTIKRTEAFQTDTSDVARVEPFKLLRAITQGNWKDPFLALYLVKCMVNYYLSVEGGEYLALLFEDALANTSLKEAIKNANSTAIAFSNEMLKIQSRFYDGECEKIWLFGF
jgi:hypothetical protein